MYCVASWRTVLQLRELGMIPVLIKLLGTPSAVICAGAAGALQNISRDFLSCRLIREEGGTHAAHTRQHCTSAHTQAYMNANRPTHLPTYLYPPTCLRIPTHLPTHLPVHGIGTKPLTDLLFVADVALQACVAATLINGAQRRHATVITCEHPPATDTGSILDAQPLLRPRSAVIGPELSDDVHSKQRSGGRRLITLCLVTAMVTLKPPDLPRAFGF